MLLTYIPYFKEIIVISFHCEHCGQLFFFVEGADNMGLS